MNDVLKVAIISPCAPPYGGITRVVENHLALWPADEIKAYLIPFDIPDQPDVPEGAQFVDLTGAPGRSWGKPWKYARALASAPISRPKTITNFIQYNRALTHFINETDIDVVYAHGTWPAGMSATLQTRITGVASVVATYGEVLGITNQHARWRRASRSVCSNATWVTATSDHCMAAALEFRAEGDPRSVIYAGIDTDRFNTTVDGAAWRLAHDIKPETVVLSILGMVFRRKLEIFVHSLQLLNSSKDVVFLVGGKGPDEGWLRETADSIPGVDVRMLGFVPDDELPEFYAASDLLIASPNTELECMGQSLKEAMACGTAVLGTRIGGIPEAIQDNVSGLLADPTDPAELAGILAKAIADPDGRRRMGKAGREVAVKRFDRRVSASQTLDVLRSAVAVLR